MNKKDEISLFTNQEINDIVNNNKTLKNLFEKENVNFKDVLSDEYKNWLFISRFCK